MNQSKPIRASLPDLAAGPLLRRTRSSDIFNAAANHPLVRPWLGGGSEPIDTSQGCRNLQNFALVGEHGGFIYVRVAVGCYEVHTLVSPEAWGGWASEAALESVRYMFARTEAVELVTKVGASNVHARRLAERVGFREMFRRDAAGEDCEGKPEPVAYMTLGVADWKRCDPKTLEEGEAFHAALDALKKDAGGPDIHPKDDAHDRAAGAAVLMARGGQAAKAAAHYNRWAALVGYRSIEVVSDAPSVIYTGDALVSIETHGLEFLV